MCSRQCVEHGLSDLTCLHVKEFVFPSFVLETKIKHK